MEEPIRRLQRKAEAIPASQVCYLTFTFVVELTLKLNCCSAVGPSGICLRHGSINAKSCSIRKTVAKSSKGGSVCPKLENFIDCAVLTFLIKAKTEGTLEAIKFVRKLFLASPHSSFANTTTMSHNQTGENTLSILLPPVHHFMSTYEHSFRFTFIPNKPGPVVSVHFSFSSACHNIEYICRK